MTLRDASLLGLIGTFILTVLLVWNLIVNILNVVRGLAPAVIVLASVIYAFTALCVTMFFYVFHRTQT